MTEPAQLKRVVWVGSSRRDLRAMPDDVQSRMGFAPYVAQQGGKHREAKALKGFGGASVVEILTDHRGDTFRCIYSVRFAGSIYVLHVFQKKSRRGRETPKAEMDLITRRLRDAERIAERERQ